MPTETSRRPPRGIFPGMNLLKPTATVPLLSPDGPRDVPDVQVPGVSDGTPAATPLIEPTIAAGD
jgi:hypothetical protein